MPDITAITVNWLTARRTLGAIESFKKFYSDIPFVVIDDGSSPKDEHKFRTVYKGNQYRSDLIYDPDNHKLKNILGVRYIQVPTHRRHGESIDYALPRIKSKWIFHIDSDVRIVKEGVIEYMMRGINDKFCGIGIQKQQHPDYPKLSNAIMIFRNDLVKEHKLKMKPIYELGLEAGSAYFKPLIGKGYAMKYLGSEIKGYYVHLRFSPEKENEWHRYF